MGVERKGEIQSLVGCTKGRREWEPVEKYEMNHLLLLRVGRKKMVPGHRAGTDSDGDSFGGTVHKGHCRLLVQELSRKANLLSAASPSCPSFLGHGKQQQPLVCCLPRMAGSEPGGSARTYSRSPAVSCEEPLQDSLGLMDCASGQEVQNL